MGLLKENADAESLLWRKNAPIYTRVHNSSPTQYKQNATVSNSMIADDCIIEGTVVNSILFRGVRIGKGTRVENSILFQGSMVSENASLNCIVTDKNVVVTNSINLSGTASMPFYIPRGEKI